MFYLRALPVLVTLLSAMALWFLNAPPVSIESIEAQLNQMTPEAVDLERAWNRAQTRAKWPSRVPIACVDEAKRAENHKSLPKLTVHGEDHVSTYCKHRREILLAGIQDRNAPTTLAYEGENFNEAYPLALDKPSGIDADGPKALSWLIYAYFYLLAYQQQGEAATVPQSMSEFMRAAIDSPITQRLLQDNRAHWITQDPRLKFTLANLESAASRKPEDWKAFQDSLLEAPRWTIAVFRKWIFAAVAMINAHGPYLGVATPVGLEREVLGMVRDMELSSHSVPSSTLLQNVDAAQFYLTVEWRDALMAQNIATIYCANLRLDQPRSSVNALVGQRHVDGIFRRLETDARALNIDLRWFNGASLSDIYENLRGKPDAKTGLYASSPLLGETIDGKLAAVTMHLDGLRFALLMEEIDPLPGTQLNQPGKLLHFGDEKRIAEHFSLKPGEPIPDRDIRRVYTQLTTLYNRTPDDQLRKSSR